MKMPRASLVCLLAIAVSACLSVPGTAPSQSITQMATTTLTAAPPTNAIAPTESSLPMLMIDPTQIVWSGSVSPSVFRQLVSQVDNREAFETPESEQVFSLFARPSIIAAYIYEASSEEQRHARFLLYEPGGKWRGEIIHPFLYKTDLPLSWIGGHEEYGNYDELVRNLKTQFENPISANKLSIGVFSAKKCADTDDRSQQLCTEMARQGIELPSDYESAEAMVMDQWNLALQLTVTQVGDIEQEVERLNAGGTAWWEDDRFALFYLPHVTVCVPGEDRPLCGTYISYKMLIDTFGLLR